MRPSVVRSLGAVALAALPLLAATPASAAPAGSTTVAIIGDTPYGNPAQTATDPTFPNLIASINSDPDVSMAVHLGDIKNGSTQCTDAYFSLVRDWFNGTNGRGPGFADPLVFTPGDNEWTDCHRANNGGFVPTTNSGATDGRLEVLRSTFFPTAGQTLGSGAPRIVTSQAADPVHGRFRENTAWVDSNVQFGIVHVVGSNNGGAVWFTGATQTPETAQQTTDRVAEVAARKAAALAWIDSVFADATANGRAGVLIGMQANLWDDPSLFPPVAAGNGVDGFDDIVARIAQRSIAFGKPVLLMQGDSHLYLQDKPLDGSAASATVAALHPYNPSANPAAFPPVTNLTRIVVPGSNGPGFNGLNSWLKVTVDPADPQVFSTSLMSATTPPAVIPEAPFGVLLSLSALLGIGGWAALHRRRARLAA